MVDIDQLKEDRDFTIPQERLEDMMEDSKIIEPLPDEFRNKMQTTEKEIVEYEEEELPIN